MDGILNKLVLPDNEAISEGTNELREAFKSSNAIPELCSVIGSSTDPQIRQLAAIILRKRLVKHRYWLKLPIETKQFVKQGLMQIFVSEQEKSVKTSIGQVIGILTRHEFPENSWPELMQFLQQKTLSEDISDKELGFFLLQILTDIAADQFLAHSHSFASLFSTTLTKLQDPATNLAWLTVMCMINFVPAIQGDQIMVNTYHGLIPQVMAVVQGLARKRPDRAIEALCLVDELCDEAVTCLVPHLHLIVNTCLQLVRDMAHEPDLQIKALNIIGMLVQAKKKQVVKLKLVEPIVDVLFAMMCVPPQDENESEYLDLEESSSPMTVASQTLDLLALHLPPDKLLSILMQKYIEPSLQQGEPRSRVAAYTAMALVCEGCSEHIRQRHIHTFITYVLSGLRDPVVAVQNAALYAVGQFSEYLQPNISENATEFVPFLLEHLQNVSKKAEVPSSMVEKMFYALDTFCDNLDEGLLPFLPMLMNYLVPLLSPPHPVRLRELAICTVASCANAAKEGIMPYFQSIMESLKMYLTEVQPPETMCLQVQSIDTLGVLARTVGNENFLPLAKESMELGLRLLAGSEDPDLHRAVYGLFASVSCVLRQDMAPYLSTIMEAIIKSVTSNSGVISNQKDDNNASVGLFENPSENDESEEDLGNTSDVSSDKDDDDVFTVENSYLEEKEQAIATIKEFAENCMECFLPYVEICFREVFSVINFPHDDIRSAALPTLAQLCIYIHRVNSQHGRQGLLNALNMLVSKCAEIIRTEREREVVVAALDVYTELLKEVGSPVLEGEGHADAIINCVKDVLNSRTECQDEGGDDSEEESEGDELIIQTAGEIVPLLGKAMPPHEFSQHYTQFLPMFFNMIQRKQSSDSQRSFGTGMLAECMSVAGPCLQSYGQQLLTLLLTLARDNDEDVRNNAIFALGELVYHGRDCIFPYYGEILHTLSTAVMSETNAGALDNICGALARLIISNTDAIPLQQVIPVFVRYLPLREDFEENKWVYQSLSHLFQRGSEPLLQNLPSVIKACAVTLHKNQIEAENCHIIINLLKNCHQSFPSECTAAANELPEDIRSTLQQACIS